MVAIYAWTVSLGTLLFELAKKDETKLIKAWETWKDPPELVTGV